MRSSVKLAVMLAVAAILAASWVMAEVPHFINYHGKLDSSPGHPVVDGDYTMIFSIYDALTGGTQLWTSGEQTVAVEDGLFRYELGSNELLPSDLFEDTLKWLDLLVNGEPVLPRSKLSSVPYAYHALRADAVIAAGGWVDDGDVVRLESTDDRVVIGDESGYAQLEVVLPFSATNDAFRVEAESFFPDPNAPLLTVKGDGCTGIRTFDPLTMAHIMLNPLGLQHEHLFYNGLILEGTKPAVSLYGDSDSTVSGAFEMVQMTDGLVDDKWVMLRESPSGPAGGDGLRFTYGTSLDPMSNTTMMRIEPDGDVGIGIDDPGSHRLYVKSSTPGLWVDGATLMVENDDTDDGIGAMIVNHSPGLTLLLSQEGEHPEGDIFRCDAWTGGWRSVFRIRNNGRVICEELEITGGSDVAEPFEISGDDALQEGAVVVIDDMNPGKLKLSDQPYDTRVAGIVSGAGGVSPGLTLNQRDVFQNGRNVAISGRVYCHVDASFGAIRPGDLLTTSPTPGHAMKAADRSRAYGAVIGKAMTGLESGQGLVLVLVSLQ